MRRLLLLLCCMLGWLPMVRAQQDAGLRTGPTIDAYERLYFGLFPDIPIFDYARVTLEHDSSLTVTIARSNNSDVTLRIPPADADVLRRTLAHYETTTLDDTRHRLLRTRILLPRVAADSLDDALVVRLADPEAGAFRILTLFDSTALAVPHAREHDTFTAPRLLAMRDITAGTVLMQHDVWTQALRGWIAGSVAGLVIVSSEGFSSNSGSRQLLADTRLPIDRQTILLLGMSQIFGIPAGLLTAGVTAMLPDSSMVDGLEWPSARRTHLAARGWRRMPPPPEARPLLTGEATSTADSLARAAWDDARDLQQDLLRIGTEGQHLGADCAFGFYNTDSYGISVPIGLHMHYAHRIGSLADEGAMLVRVGFGGGVPSYTYADLSLIAAPAPQYWFQAGMSYEAITIDLGTYSWGYAPKLDMSDFGRHLFAGAGVGFRTGMRWAVEFSLRVSLHPVIVTHKSEWIPPSWGSLPAPDPQHHVILRGTLSYGL